MRQLSSVEKRRAPVACAQRAAVTERTALAAHQLVVLMAFSCHDDHVAGMGGGHGGTDRLGAIGLSKAPYREWTWTPLRQPLGGPNFIELPDGRLIAGSRGFGAQPGPHMVIYKLTPTTLEPLIELPSSGDCSYPGLLWHDDFLHVTYYSGHEGGKAAVYYAKLKLK